MTLEGSPLQRQTESRWCLGLNSLLGAAKKEAYFFSHAVSLPNLNPSGLLPGGIHDCSLDDAAKRFVTNPHREAMWKQLLAFIEWTRSLDQFDILYLDGGYISDKPRPEDIDVILQTRAKYGTAALESMTPFFLKGLDNIFTEFGVHLHFWSEGFPGGIHDFRLFFQYVRPQDAAPRGLQPGATKGIVRIRINGSTASTAPARREEEAFA